MLAIWRWLWLGPVLNFGEGLVDNVFRAKVQPKIGSVVYCDLIFGYAEYSGIYIGGNKIVTLSRSGAIASASPSEFISGGTAISIYVSCRNKSAVGSRKVARRARRKIGRSRDYSFLTDNCHQFTAGCLSGDFNNNNNFLWFLKDEARTVLGANRWRVWELSSQDLFPS